MTSEWHHGLYQSYTTVTMNGGPVAPHYPLSKPPQDPLASAQPLHIPAKRPTAWPPVYPHVSKHLV